MFLRVSVPSVRVRDCCCVMPIAAKVCTKLCTNYFRYEK